MDLEAWEDSLRRAALGAGAKVLERLLEGIGSGGSMGAVLCPCGGNMNSVGRRSKEIRTILGSVRFNRSLYQCPRCGAWRLPGDELLGVENTAFSPGARRMMARAGSRSSFSEASEDLRIYAAIELDPKDVERVAEAVGRQIQEWMEVKRKEALDTAGRTATAASSEQIPVMYVSFDGTGVPMRSRELEGRKGKGEDGKAKTREVKLGCVFTQTKLDDDGYPIRDPASTTYVGAIEDSEAFGWRVYAEAQMRGLERARMVVVLTDGAAYNKSIVQLHFPWAIHIIDLYHAREHLAILLELLVPELERKRDEQKWLELLDQGRIEELLQRARERLPRSGRRRLHALKEIHYFENNKEHMRYRHFRDEGLFIGSGVVEAGCRTLIGQRLKKSGMFWTVAGANAIIASRCCQYSNRFEDFWAQQAA